MDRAREHDGSASAWHAPVFVVGRLVAYVFAQSSRLAQAVNTAGPDSAISVLLSIETVGPITHTTYRYAAAGIVLDGRYPRRENNSQSNLEGPPPVQPGPPT
jgi:hypothetical protein